MIHLSENRRFIFPPNKYKVEWDATGDYDERHRYAKSLVRQGERQYENE